MKNFEGIKHFTPQEFIKTGGEPERMDRNFLLKLDAFREYLGSSIFVNHSTGGQHTSASQHYLGLAVDIFVPNFGGSLLSLYLIAERFNFTGIGIYPEWQYQDAVSGGLHLDERVLDNYHSARWIGITNNDRNKYIALTPKNLIETGILTKVK